ncbi:hypothetical protein BKA64DRAFT_660552 [Cadophora sp. MPI-SDFR-AT-0126]|nr:hypothetical protein BKA64DRAFT_660552 [Leotiomycetes sp. MPI-SDFR-AT-0126]
MRLPTGTHLHTSFRFICCLLLVAASNQQVSLPGVRIDDPNKPPALFTLQDNATSQLTPSSTLVKSSTSTISTIPSATPTTTTPEDSGLATGAKAGIGVGTALGIILLIGIVVFTVRWRRRAGAVKFGTAEERFEKAELDATTIPSNTEPVMFEFDGDADRPGADSERKQRRVELDGRMLRSELA